MSERLRVTKAKVARVCVASFGEDEGGAERLHSPCAGSHRQRFKTLPQRLALNAAWVHPVVMVIMKPGRKFQSVFFGVLWRGS